MDGVGEREERPMLETGLITSSHPEKHFRAAEVVRDVIMGMSDGLTVPFALAAGLSGASAPSSLVVTAGLAEVAAGAISMGLGGYLAAKSEADHYEREMKREQEEIITVPDIEAAEIGEIMAQYGLEPHEYGPVVKGLQRRPFFSAKLLHKHMLIPRDQPFVNSDSRSKVHALHWGTSKSLNAEWFELGLEKPDPRRALQSALTIALSYVVGGLVPLLPYMFMTTAHDAMLTSVVVTLAALLFFGYVKGRFTGSRPILSAL
ncbi:hypothetical protein ACQ4PT_016449 [Festuca glaucescens]